MQNVKVAIVACVFKEGKILLGRRMGTADREGMWNAPGGHLEQHEALVDGAIRETREEAGIEIENVRFLCVTNGRSFSDAHFIVFTMYADWKSGEARICEPDKCDSLGWYALDELPDPLTPGTLNGIVATQTGQACFDV